MISLNAYGTLIVINYYFVAKFQFIVKQPTNIWHQSIFVSFIYLF